MFAKKLKDTFKAHQKFLTGSIAALFVFFAFALIQNYIRYGYGASYDITRTIKYLLSTVLLFIPFLPFILYAYKKTKNKNPSYYWPRVFLSIPFLLFIFFLLSNSAMYLFGFFDSIPSSKYAKQYFGREALFHSIIMVACGLYIQYGNREVKVARHKIITAYLGKKEMSIQSKDIDWVEVDDHYLKIHVNGKTLIKRASLEKFTDLLKPDFVRIHRKYLVNKARIIGKEKNQRDEYILLANDQKLKIGRSYSPFKI